MESNINHQLINSYSKSFAEQLINDFFKKKSSIKGEEIPNFSEIKQINYFVLKILFEKWKSEFNNLKSPYFNYKCDEVQKAVNTFMNVLSKNILVGREDFRLLLEEATYKTILLIFSPYEYYLQEINKPDFQQISINDLYAIQKYVKINGHLLKAYIDRFNSEGIQAVFNDDAVRIFDEVCETIKETPEDFDFYLQELSKVIVLDLNEVYSHSDDIAEDYVEDDLKGEPDNINEKFKTKRQTLLDTLGAEKKEAILDIHEKKPLAGIKKSIAINQRFMFENDLFNGDKDEFEMVVNYLDNCTSNREAMEFINENYVKKKNWDMKKEEVIEFFSVINKRFPQ
ncbi:MAG: hypothetical protein KAQ79_13255 [Cyclobacteriaceae bacterium]|nr:hypothetical protein [Cyclobacteriaceae bacterium]